MTTYFSADFHFNHGNRPGAPLSGILSFTDRPWGDVVEMNEALVDAWNAVVRQGDDVWVLGDFCFQPTTGPMKASSIFHRLHGHKHLIVGNHDEQNKAVLRLPWSSVDWLRHPKIEGQRVALCHYALESWWHAHKGVLHLHGHSHGTLSRQVSHRFDVGIDAMGRDFNYGPIPFEAIRELAKAQDFNPVDHHGAI